MEEEEGSRSGGIWEAYVSQDVAVGSTLIQLPESGEMVRVAGGLLAEDAPLLAALEMEGSTEENPTPIDLSPSGLTDAAVRTVLDVVHSEGTSKLALRNREPAQDARSLIELLHAADYAGALAAKALAEAALMDRHVDGAEPLALLELASEARRRNASGLFAACAAELRATAPASALETADVQLLAALVVASREVARTQAVLASASDDGTVLVWDAATGEKSPRVVVGDASRDSGRADLGACTDVAIEGAYLATSSADGVVGLWTCRGARVARIEHRTGVEAVALCRGLIASGSRDGEIRVFRREDTAATCLWATQQGHDHRITSLAFSADGQTLASASAGKTTVSRWTSEDGASLDELSGHFRWVHAVAFSHAQPNLLASASGDRTVRIWRSSQRSDVLEGHRSEVFAVAFSRDDSLLSSGAGDDAVRLWTTGEPNPTCIRVFLGHTETVTGLAFSRDDALLASGSLDATVRVWRVATDGDCLRVLRAHTKAVNAIAM